MAFDGQHSYQPIRSHIKKMYLANSDFNPANIANPKLDESMETPTS